MRHTASTVRGPAKAASRLSRWTIDLSSNSDSFTETRLSEAVGEFPRIDDRYAMAPYRHGYMAVQDNTKPFTLKGGSITGITNFEYSMGGKWLELLKQIAPELLARHGAGRQQRVDPVEGYLSPAEVAVENIQRPYG